MLGSVFLMQPVGQALAQLVGLWVLIGREREYGLQAMQCGINTKYDEECKKIVDGIWRIVIGSGAVPALLAIIFRFFLFDCGIYSLEVRNKPDIALMNTQRIYGAPNTGGFDGNYTADRNLATLREGLLKAATSATDLPVAAILIEDIARQAG